MSVKNIIEMAEDLNSGVLSFEDKEVQTASNALKDVFSTENGRQELAELVRVNLDEVYNKFDIGQFLFHKKHFELGEEPIIRTHKRGVKAYWTALDGYIPMSTNYDTELPMNFETIGVHPYCSKRDLEIGKISSFGTLVKDGKEAVEDGLTEKAFKVVAQTYNSTSNADNYIATSDLDASVLGKAITKLRKTGKTPTIFTSYDLADAIENLVGFEQCDEKYKELAEKGVIGRYKGCNVVYIPDVKDPATNKNIMPTNIVLVVGDKIGYEGTRGKSDTEQQVQFGTKMWECLYGKQVGYTITNPEYMVLIEVTE